MWQEVLRRFEKPSARQRDGAHCAGADPADGLDRRGVRDPPPAPIFSGVAVFHRRGVDDPGRPGLAAFAARGRAQDGKSVRVAGRALRHGHLRAALLCFTVVVLAYNLLSLPKRCVEHTHHQKAPQLDISTAHLAQHFRGANEGLLIAVATAHWPTWAPQEADQVVQRLLALVRRIIPCQVATSKRGPKIEKPKGWIAGSKAQTHVSTARVLKAAMEQRPRKGCPLTADRRPHDDTPPG